MCNGNLIVTLPPYICPDQKNRIISIDLCIISQIRGLWDANVQTHGCCCGHGKNSPSVVIDSGANLKEISRIDSTLKALDFRPWRVLQWQIVVVAGKSKHAIATRDAKVSWLRDHPELWDNWLVEVGKEQYVIDKRGHSIVRKMILAGLISKGTFWRDVALNSLIAEAQKKGF